MNRQRSPRVRTWRSPIGTTPDLRPCVPWVRPRSTYSNRLAQEPSTRPGDVRMPTNEQKTSRIAQRAAQVGAVGDGQHSAGQRHRRAAARPATGLRQIPRIPGAPEHWVESLRSRADFGRVGFADGDGARALRAFDQKRAEIRHVILENRRSKGGAQAAGFGQIFVGDGKPVQRAEKTSPRAAPSSARKACARACSSARVTIAFTCGFSRAICARCASSTSRAESSFAAQCAGPFSVALRKQMSSFRVRPSNSSRV